MMKKIITQTYSSRFKHLTIRFSTPICVGLLSLVAGSCAVAQCQSIIDVDFNNWNNNQIYSIANAKADFNDQIKPGAASTYRGIGAPGAPANLIETVKQTTRVVDGTLRAHYTKNDAGGLAGGFLFDPYFDGVEEAYLEYKVKFDKNFLWQTGGKLPGLGGSATGINSETAGRGSIPSGCKYNDNGFSARLMWRRNVAHTQDPYLILYSYFAKKEDNTLRQPTNDCGDGYRIFTGLEDDKWYTIKQYMKLNTPGRSDGTVIMWINGVETFKQTDFMIRKSGKGNVKINQLVINTYRGGNRTDTHWQSPRDEYAFFDDFKVWTGCANLPNTTPNSAPTVRLASPQNDANFTLGATINLLATANDADGTIQKVNFKVNDSFYAQDSDGPTYAGTFTPTEPGTYKIAARAFDDQDLAHEEFVTVHVYGPKRPFNGLMGTIPGTIQAENYDEGGPDVGYSDSDTENKGSQQSNFRTDHGVDIGSANGGNVLGWTSTGEWTEYTLNVLDAGQYDVTIHYSAPGSNGQLGLSADGSDLFSTLNLPSTGDYGTYGSVTERLVPLRSGEQVLRLSVVSNGFNVDRIEFAQSTITSLEAKDAFRELRVFPNPSQSGVFKLDHPSTWSVIDLQGQTVLEGSGTTIDLGTQKGVYLLKAHGSVERLMVE